MVVGNGRIPPHGALSTLPDSKQDYISILLPDWFRVYKGKRIIKIYGTQLYQVYSDDRIHDYNYDAEMPMEATLHSNVVGNNNTGTLVDPSPELPDAAGPPKPGMWIPSGPASGDINDLYNQYVLTANNFYTPKTYEYTDNSLQELRFWFKNRYGAILPVYYIFHDPDNTLIYATFLLFKIEIELLTVKDEKYYIQPRE
jgi:hypothetical protein